MPFILFGLQVTLQAKCECHIKVSYNQSSFIVSIVQTYRCMYFLFRIGIIMIESLIRTTVTALDTPLFLFLDHFYWYSRLVAGSGVVDLWPAPISIMLIASLTNGSSENIIKHYIYIVSVVSLIFMHLKIILFNIKLHTKKFYLYFSLYNNLDCQNNMLNGS